MRSLATAAAVIVASASMLLAAESTPSAAPTAQATVRKACEELKSEIEAKLEAKGVKNYTLEIVPNDKAAELKEGKIVGSCDGGTQKIVYTKAK